MFPLPMFCRNNIAVFDEAAENPWYLSGGISTANCITAYNPKGAVSAAAAKVDLQGNYNATLLSANEPWASGQGWVFVNANANGMLLGTHTVYPSVVAGHSVLVSFTGIDYNNYDTPTILRSTDPLGSEWVMWAGMVGSKNLLIIDTNTTLGSTLYSGAPTSGILLITPTKAYLDGVDISDWLNDGANMTSGQPISIGCTYDYALQEVGSTMTGTIRQFAYYNIDIAPYAAELTAAVGAL